MYLERRVKKREQEEKEEKEKEALKAQLKMNDPLGPANPQVQQSGISGSNEKQKEENKKKKKSLWSGLGRRKEEEVEKNQTEEANENDVYNLVRPAFYANVKPSKRNQVPRDVAVPYFRFRKDRFYDWPPDPTVSRATPMATSTAKTYIPEHETTRRRRPSLRGFSNYSNENTQGSGIQNKARQNTFFNGRLNEFVGLRQRKRYANDEEVDYGYE